MPRHPLLRRTLLLVMVLAAAACGQEDENDLPPPTPVPMAAVGPSPPFDSLAAAPESLAVAGVRVRLESSLFQNYMPGEGHAEDPVDPRSMVSGGVWLLPMSAGVITGAWMLEGGEAERLDAYRVRNETSVSGRPLPRLQHVDLVVRFRTAAGETLLLQQRAAPVMKVE